MMPKPQDVCRIFTRWTLFGFGVLNAYSQAATVNVQVNDRVGHPIPNTVVYAESVAEIPSSTKTLAPLQVEQKEKKFFPLVSVIKTGTSVSFPNNDTVRHHVYSFSPAKNFELKLYAGVPSAPIVFDKAGTVVLGCNIHDKMVAYIHVVNTPYFSKTNEQGEAKLDGLAPGKYILKAWHFNLPTNQAVFQQPITVTDTPLNIPIQLKIKPVFLPDSDYIGFIPPTSNTGV